MSYTVTGPLQFYIYIKGAPAVIGALGHDLTIFMNFLIVVL